MSEIRQAIYNGLGVRAVWTYEYAECRTVPWYMGLAHRNPQTQTLVLYVVPLNWIVGWSRQLWNFLRRGPHKWDLERRERRLFNERSSFDSEMDTRTRMMDAAERANSAWCKEQRARAGAWISVKDRTPAREGEYLVYTYEPKIAYAETHEGATYFDNGSITHWMHLPPAPQPPAVQDTEKQ